MDEARVGQKGRTGHRWWVQGQRPPGFCNKRFASAYLFAAVRPATGEDFCLVLPRVCTEAMDRFLLDFAATVPADTHAVMVLDGAGWHASAALKVPENITLLPLPPHSPELNPVENVWAYLLQNWLSLQVWDDYPAIVEACCQAWSRFLAQPEVVQSVTTRAWAKVNG